MRVLIIEDEQRAVENLSYMLNSIPHLSIQIEKVVDSVDESIDFLSAHQADIDLIFMDIHLADGISFEIFEHVEVQTPIIFTTAFDDYAIQAFKVNSIDYLLKPVNQEELTQALEKFAKTRQAALPPQQTLQALLQDLTQGKSSYISTLLIAQGDGMIPVAVKDIAYIYIQNSIVKVVTENNKRYHLDKKLEELAQKLSPALFFRANRQFIINKTAITKISYYFNGKLSISLHPPHQENAIVSKAKAKELKNWISTDT